MSSFQPVPQLARSPVVLVNPRAGAYRRGVVGRLAAELGLAGRAIQTIGPDGAARTLAAQAVRDGASLVVAVGGDGTIHEIVQQLAGTTTALGIVPVGTSNDLATALGLTRRGDLIWETLADGAVAAIDLIWTRSAWIASAGGLGLPSEIALRCNQLRVGPHRRWAGRLGSAIYSLVGAHQILHGPLPVTRYDLDAHGFRLSRLGTALLVSRVPRCGGLQLALGPVEPGTFCVVLVTARTRGGLLKVLARLRLGLPLGRGAVIWPDIADLRVRTQALVRAFGDGEILGVGYRARFRLVPDALRVLVPRAWQGADWRQRREVG